MANNYCFIEVDTSVEIEKQIHISIKQGSPYIPTVTTQKVLHTISILEIKNAVAVLR